MKNLGDDCAAEESKKYNDMAILSNKAQQEMYMRDSNIKFLEDKEKYEI